MDVITRELPGRRDLLALQQANPGRYPALLESVALSASTGRFDILFAFPQSVLRMQQLGRVTDASGAHLGTRFLDVLDDACALDLQASDRAPAKEPSRVPFRGGWLLYLGYELAGEIEPTVAFTPATATVPVALAIRCPVAVVLDHARDCTILIAEGEFADRIDQLIGDLAIARSFKTTARLHVNGVREDAPEQFLAGVERVHEHLRAGDVFQVNLSRAWELTLAEPTPTPAEMYAALRAANPAPFAGLLQQPGWSVISSSPERLVQSIGSCVQTRPIAGTRARIPGDDDAIRIRELIEHPKERAEHVMLIDLERNDLGRVAVPGSVEVSEFMGIESYAHVHHIVSNVRAQLREGSRPGDIIRSVFPGGTITGCPKVRCMQIIAELEGTRRGAYTGALGYLNRDGDMDLNILIRSLTVVGQSVSFRAGAGIVADSIGAAELAETRAKARGMLRAFGLTDE